MRFILFCTHQYNARGLSDFNRLVGSIGVQLDKTLPEIQLHCLVQGVHALPADLPQGRFVRYLTSPVLLGLSKARNVLLAASNIEDNDFVLFPDDDCWYPDGFFRTLTCILSSRGSHYFIWSFSEQPSSMNIIVRHSVSALDVLYRSTSICFCLSGELARAVDQFDEELGLGSQLRSAEDTDYAFRAFRLTDKCSISPNAMVGHRDMNRTIAQKFQIAPKYWPGMMLVSLRYFDASLTMAILYRVFLGILFVLLKKLKITDFFSPFRHHWKARI